MLRSIVIFVGAGLLGTLLGITVGNLFYPHVFLDDIVATEQVTGLDQRAVAATGSFVHGPGYRLFGLGQPASGALWQLAEESSTAAFEALADPQVHAVVIAPVVTSTLEAPDDLTLSMAAMISLTNWGFVAAQGLPLAAAPGPSVSTLLRGDADIPPARQWHEPALGRLTITPLR